MCWEASWTPGQGYRFEKDTAWHGAKNGAAPLLDAVDVRIFADDQAAGLAIDAGQVDLMLEVEGAVAKRFRDQGQTSIAPKVGLIYAGCNVTNPMLRDPRIRQALFLAIDRERFVTEVGEGFGQVTVQSWPSTSPACDKALDAPFYDPAKAKQLLSEAGFSQDRPLKVEYTANAFGQVAQLLKENLCRSRE